MLLKTFLASLAAKIALGTGLAVATVTAAGAAGVLPEPAHNAVASVVEATTPFDVADPVVRDVQDVVDDPTTTTTSTTVASGDDGVTDTTRKLNHGACVSAVAKNTPAGPDKGKTVSSVARSDCGKTSTSTTVAPSTSTSSTSTTVAGSSTTSSTLDDGLRSTNSGPGNANNGRGNSGKNGSGSSSKK
jgi:hypothetical protein